jgi:hypothetical protein
MAFCTSERPGPGHDRDIQQTYSFDSRLTRELGAGTLQCLIVFGEEGIGPVDVEPTQPCAIGTPGIVALTA